MIIARQTYDHPMPVFAWPLGLAGTMPFWIAAVLLWSHVDPVSASRAVALSIAYGAVVLSFLGGTRWGSALVAEDRLRLFRDRLLAIVPGAAGFAAMFMPPVIALNLLISLFLWQALWDLTSAQDGRLPYWSGMLRVTLTALTVPALLAMLGKIIFTVI